jgi:hypothetical protein
MKVANVDDNAGKSLKSILTGRSLGKRAWKFICISLEFEWKALEAMKMQDGLGASPRGQRRSERPYDSWIHGARNEF